MIAGYNKRGEVFSRRYRCLCVTAFNVRDGNISRNTSAHWCYPTRSWLTFSPIILTIPCDREKSCTSEKLYNRTFHALLSRRHAESQTNPEAQSSVTCAFLEHAGVKCRLWLRLRLQRQLHPRGCICQLYGNVSRCRCNLREAPSCI